MNIKSSNSLLRTSGIYTLTNMFNAGIPFLLLPLLTRYLSPEEFGITAMFTVLFSFCMPLISININGTINRNYYDRDKIDFSSYVFNCIVIMISSTVLISFIVYFMSSKLSDWTSVPDNWIWTVVVSCFFQTLTLINLIIWQVQMKPKQYGIYMILQTAFSALLTVYLLVIFDYGWEGRLAAQVVGYVLFGIVSVFMLTRNKWIKYRFNVDYIKDALKYGVPLIPHIISGLIITMIDRVFLTNFEGVEATGIYLVGYQIGSMIGVLQDAFNRAWTPWLFDKLKKDSIELKMLAIKYTYFYIVIILIIALTLGVSAPLLLKYLVGNEYHNASQYVIWIALGFAFNGMYKMVTNYLFYLKRTGIVAIITGCTALLNIILSYMFIHYLGVSGAAYATCISFFISFIGTWIAVIKLYPLPWIATLHGMVRSKH
ncbi:flippase [Paenibacillus sp. PR3]|uniref:Flippase n=1 Tax=Paenibacillus terricola TaxID=2763503 RepID=A0ABR8MXM0_9BACL|nr:flippase [Paenibacillus terricola]MBD3920702.1 flippase [Paenibacillus terricola]